MASFTVRAVERRDFDQWLQLWDGYNAFYGRAGETALSEAVTQSTWQRFFDAEAPDHALVAEENGELLGLAHYLFHLSTNSESMSCYMQDLFTSESVRGKGVGRALIDAVCEVARDAGSPRVYWQTHETNRTARELYDRVAEYSGFVVYRKTL
jgi:GNAT superfamily N-acetyltransferase